MANNIPILVHEQTPYLGVLSLGMQVGDMVRIKLQIQGFKNWGNINLTKGPMMQPQDNVMLHLSIRPIENVVVRNIYYNNEWGSEERNGSCPVGVNAIFEVLILATDTFFKIALNGKHFCNFKHRLPLDQVRFISIKGDCIVHHVTFEKEIRFATGNYPASYPTK